MNINAAGRAAAILIFFSLFSACGELETLLPSTGSYQVKALVNGSSLESCSILRSDDTIRPYFAVSVIDDPDLIGLLVYFENSQGEVIGEKVRYILQSHANEVRPAETEIEEKTKTSKTDEKTLETTTTTEETTIEEITQETEESEKTEENEVKEQKAGELPEQGTVKEVPSITDVKPVVKITNVDIVVKSLSGELPYLPLPKTLEIGSYTLVFEAIGVKGTLSQTETNVFYLDNAEFQLKDISMYLPGQSGSQLIPPETTVMLKAKLDFDKRLDPYVIWYNGKNIISEGKISNGAGTILWKAPEQAGFYSLRMEAFPLQLRRTNYTGIFREITLPVSPKAGTLGHFFENNREYTARTPLAAGTAYPEQVHLITAIRSIEDTDKAKGKSAPVLPSPPELLRWYQFEGSLHNSTSPLTDAQSLMPVNAKAPRWAATGQSYGLSTGSNDVYSLSPINFFCKESDQGGGIFLFHIMPATEGVIFSAFFPLQSSSTDGVWMYMVREGNSVTLRLSAENTVVEMPVYLTFPESQDLIPIVVEFYIRPYRLEAKLSLGAEYSLENKVVGNIKLFDALSGEGRIRLGGVMDKSMLDKSMLTAETNSAEKDADITSASKTLSQTVIQNTIWDEFAVLFSTIPLLEEESQTELAVEEQGAAETKAAKQKGQYETGTTTAADYKSKTVFESAVTEIPMPDTDETKASPITSN